MALHQTDRPLQPAREGQARRSGQRVGAGDLERALGEVEATREEVSALVQKKRRENLRRLQAIQDRMIDRLEAELDTIKPRELSWHVKTINDVSTAMIDRDIPAPNTNQGAQVIVNGLSREEALALISGHREAKKKPPANG